MAPEQLQTTAAYLGTAVDVWASGIMLLVMMVRTLLRVPQPRLAKQGLDAVG